MACNGRPVKPLSPAMSKTRRYMIEVTDMKTGDIVVFTGADWTLEERGVAVAQIMRLAAAPDDNSAPAEKPAGGRS